MTTNSGLITSFPFKSAAANIARVDMNLYNDDNAPDAFVDNIQLSDGGPLITQNFDAIAASDYNEASDVGGTFTEEADQISVVDSVSTPVDPFGGVGNKSLRLYGGVDGRVRYDGAGSVSGAGRFSMDFNVADGLFRVDLEDDTGNNGVQLVADCRGGSTILRYDTPSININFDQTVSAGTDYELVVDFDTDTDTFSGTINGTPLTVGVQTVFPFIGLATEIAKLDLQTYHDAGYAADVFVDNIWLGVAPAFLVGDANNDGVVSADHYGSVQLYFGDTGAPGGGLLGDANQDGVVSADDFGSVQLHFGEMAGGLGSVPVPEPATIGLLGIGGLLMLVRKKR